MRYVSKAIEAIINAITYKRYYIIWGQHLSRWVQTIDKNGKAVLKLLEKPFSRISDVHILRS